MKWISESRFLILLGAPHIVPVVLGAGLLGLARELLLTAHGAP